MCRHPAPNLKLCLMSKCSTNDLDCETAQPKPNRRRGGSEIHATCIFLVRGGGGGGMGWDGGWRMLGGKIYLEKEQGKATLFFLVLSPALPASPPSHRPPIVRNSIPLLHSYLTEFG